jgi:ribonuclease-3 family protein
LGKNWWLKGMSNDMVKGIDSYLKQTFQIPDVDIRTYSPLTLAYIGDGIYDLVIRSLVVAKGNTKAGELHKRTSQIVKAHTQAEMMKVIEPLLTEEEADIYRRGRNAKSPTMAKNATMSDYRKATGFEALMGWLYLQDEFERLVELVKAAVEELHLQL